MKSTKDIIIDTGKAVGTGVLYGLAVLVSKVAVEDIIDMVKYKGKVEYSDVIDIIMKSNMFSGDKTRAIAAIKKNGDVEYYRAAIRVIKSNMYGGDKVKTLEQLNTNEEEAE